jgi:hypothetical protein
MTSVKCEAEYGQDACIHRLERVDPKIEHGFRYHCLKCGAWLLRKNGVVISGCTYCARGFPCYRHAEWRPIRSNDATTVPVPQRVRRVPV